MPTADASELLLTFHLYPAAVAEMFRVPRPPVMDANDRNYQSNRGPTWPDVAATPNTGAKRRD